MKKLQKIKLINWHTFQNHTIEITGNVLVSGKNSTGKSTLLDSIQYVLSGGSQKFNQAANEKSARTLESYIRGKINNDHQKYIREGDVTSYIALQFVDESTGRYDIIGAVIEITVATKVNRSFFKISNMELDDSMFILDNAPKTMHEFKREKNVNFFDTKNEIQEMICSVLGLNGRKYFDLLLKAIFFKPIEELNEFVNSFLLPEKNVSIDNLRQNVEELRDLLNIIELEEKKIVILEELERLDNEYKSKNDEISKNNWLKEKVSVEKIKRRINDLEDNKGNSVLKITEYKKLKQDNQNEINRLEEFKKEYIDNYNGNNEVSLYITLDKRLNELKDKLKDQEILFKSYVKEFNKFNKDLSIFNWGSELKLFKEFGRDSSKIRDVLFKITKLMEEEKDGISALKVEYRSRIDDINGRIGRIDSKLKRLNVSKLPYDENILMLQDTIKRELYDKYNEDIEVRPLCEYLEVNDDTWRDAIEGYLNKQRFDLIVEPKYFDDALKIYDKNKKEKKIYGVGLVNTKKFRDVDVVDNTLASCVSASNIYADRYAKYLLNRVLCCEKVEDLVTNCERSKEMNGPKQGITRTCMTYVNHVARQINPFVYEDYFIGEKATIQQKDKYEMAYKELIKLKDDAVKKLNDLAIKYDKLDVSEVNSLIQKLVIVDEYNGLIVNKEQTERDMANLKVDGLINNIKEEIDRFSDKIDTLKEENGRLNGDINRLEIQIGNDEREIEDLTLDISLRVDTLNIIYEWEDELKELFKKNLDKVIDSLNSRIIDLEKNVKDIENNIVIKLSEYNNKYEFDEIPKVENVGVYLQELLKIREHDLVRHKSDVLQFREQCQISFREDFISQIREQILSTQDEIKNLNKSLKKQIFGKEKYEFICRKSDVTEMANYYDIIVSGNNFSRHNLFEEILSPEQRDCMDVLFEKLTAVHTDANMNKVLQEYTDYRNYMSYDIKVSNEDGNYYYLSDSLREKSGGELQTPFYVIIAASFEQLLKNGRREGSVGCIVMFDEAFNNMDESRIGAMMRFYSDLNIQLIIAVPPDKVANIAPYVNTMLIVNRDKNTSYTHRISWESLGNE